MTATSRHRRYVGALILALAVPPAVRATVPDVADHSIKQFLAQADEQPAYRATRRLEAENGDRRGWLEAITEYSPDSGFHYEITAEGGSGYIRTKVLRAVLDAERDAIARGEAARASLARDNYSFQPNGIDAEGLANILLSPRREERVLVSGTMFLRPNSGELVRLQGRLAKSPSFWVKNVDIVRSYTRLHGVVMPVALESNAQVRMFGSAWMKMTYAYTEIGGQPVISTQMAQRQ